MFCMYSSRAGTQRGLVPSNPHQEGTQGLAGASMRGMTVKVVEESNITSQRSGGKTKFNLPVI